MRTVVLYGRDGCCLCDDAREILLRVRGRRPFVLEERDIDARRAAVARVSGAHPGGDDRRR